MDSEVYCECGCGQLTPLAKNHVYYSGIKKGEPLRFIPGHQRRTRSDWTLLFWSKVDKQTNGCWLWLGSKQQDGYGHFTLERVSGTWTKCAHKVAYELLVGPVPDGLVLDHAKCQNKGCVNPAHLEPVTQKVNLLRSKLTVNSINAAKTHCKHGHEFTPENTYVYVKTGTRHCRACQRERTKERKLNKCHT